MHTKQEIVMKFGKGHPDMRADITIPAGTRCIAADNGDVFVDDLSFLDPRSMTHHDATYYGIRLKADLCDA